MRLLKEIGLVFGILSLMSVMGTEPGPPIPRFEEVLTQYREMADIENNNSLEGFIFNSIIDTSLIANGEAVKIKLVDLESVFEALRNPELFEVLTNPTIQPGVYDAIARSRMGSITTAHEIKNYFEATWPTVKDSLLEKGEPQVTAVIPAIVRSLGVADEFKQETLPYLKVLFTEAAPLYPGDFKLNRTSHGSYANKQHIQAACLYLPSDLAFQLISADQEFDSLAYPSCMLRLGKGTDEHRRLLQEQYFTTREYYLDVNTGMRELPFIGGITQWLSFSNDRSMIKLLADDLMPSVPLKVTDPEVASLLYTKYRRLSQSALNGLAHLSRYRLRPLILTGIDKADWADYAYCIKQLHADTIEPEITFPDWFSQSQREYCATQLIKENETEGVLSILENGILSRSSIGFRLQDLAHPELRKVFAIKQFLLGVRNPFLLNERNDKVYFLASNFSHDAKINIGFSGFENLREGMAPLFDTGLLVSTTFEDSAAFYVNKGLLNSNLSQSDAKEAFRARDDWHPLPLRFYNRFSEVLHFEYIHSKKKQNAYSFHYIAMRSAGSPALHPERVRACSSWREFIDLIPTEYPNVRIIYQPGRIIFQDWGLDMLPYPGKSFPACQ